MRARTHVRAHVHTHLHTNARMHARTHIPTPPLVYPSCTALQFTVTILYFLACVFIVARISTQFLEWGAARREDYLEFKVRRGRRRTRAEHTGPRRPLCPGEAW